jgi:hypothetical protein
MGAIPVREFPSLRAVVWLLPLVASAYSVLTHCPGNCPGFILTSINACHGNWPNLASVPPATLFSPNFGVAVVLDIFPWNTDQQVNHVHDCRGLLKPWMEVYLSHRKGFLRPRIALLELVFAQGHSDILLAGGVDAVDGGYDKATG